jgi:hypothetical protein
MSKVAQMRVLTIQAGEIDAFIQAWKNTILPLRKKYGFHTESAWTIPERNEFYWILSYSGLEAWDDVDERVYLDLVQTGIVPDALRYVNRVERWFIQPVGIGPTEPAFPGDGEEKQNK